MNRRDRWVAPKEDGGVLIDPDPACVAELLDINRRRLAATRVTLLGRPLADVRSAAAARIHTQIGQSTSSQAPFIVSGHQPELFHAGVWVKNFALNGLARRHGLVPLNLIVDGDTIKSTSVHLPALAHDPARIHRVAVPFDAWTGEEPYTFRSIHDRALFDSFPRRVAEYACHWGFAPLLPDFWSAVEQRLAGQPDAKIGDLFVAARRGVEQRWGCRNVEMSLGEVCLIPELLGHVLADLPRFHAAYNDSIRHYRNKYGLRSRHHPAPELAADGDRLEAPFWWFDRDARRRQRLFVRSCGDILELFAGPDARPVSVRRAAPEVFAELAADGVQIATRALMTTMFARLGLADLFVHGIGGAKYDEVTDDIIRRYFGIEPPEYMVVTGTLRLPLPHFPGTPSQRSDLWRHLRDLRWHPEQFTDAPGAAEKRRWLARKPSIPAEKRERYRELLRLTESLRPAVQGRSAEAEMRLARCDRELAANAILSRRDYSFVLYPEEMLRPFCTQLL